MHTKNGRQSWKWRHAEYFSF